MANPLPPWDSAEETTTLHKEVDMDFFDLVQRRYSVRAYLSKAVEEEKIQQILEAGRLAPSAANRQPFHIFVIHPQGREEDIRRIYAADWFVHAPVIIGIVALPEKAWTRRDGKNYSDVDAAIAMDHMILAATALGLGTCWIGAFDPTAAQEVLGLPEGAQPVAFTPVGYPADEPRPKRRKPLDELVRYEHW